MFEFFKKLFARKVAPSPVDPAEPMKVGDKVSFSPEELANGAASGDDIYMQKILSMSFHHGAIMGNVDERGNLHIEKIAD